MAKPKLTRAQLVHVRKLRRQGLSWPKIAKVYGVHEHTVRHAVHPEQRAKLYAAIKRFRERHPDKAQEQERIANLRKQARLEAAETGEPVLKVYARWKCLSPRDFREPPAMIALRLRSKELWRKRNGAP